MRLANLIPAALLVAVAAAVANVPGQVPQFGNGYVATFANASLEYVSGVYDGSNVTSTRAGLPQPLRSFLGCPSGLGEMAYDSPYGTAYPFQVNMTAGLIVLRGACGGGAVNVTQTWFAHRVHRHLSVLMVEVEALATAVSGGQLVFPVTTYTSQEPEWAAHMQQRFNYSDSDVDITAYETLTPEEPVTVDTPIGTVHVAYAVSARFSRGASVTLRVAPPGGADDRVLRGSASAIAARCSGLDAPGGNTGSAVLQFATATFNDHRTDTAEELRASHVAAWAALWQRRMTATVSEAAEGSATFPQVLEASQYALLCALRADWPFSTSPGGLATDGYNGHTFWDMETWMLPSLTLFQPAIAQGSALEYRLNRLVGASANARTVVGGTAGAAFPWESALTGFDVCPWPQGEHSEIHITADVMMGIRQHFYATGDVVFLARYYQLLLEASRFWFSRATLDAATGKFSINNVTPPDEYHFGNNSAYTNAAVSLAVAFTAVEAATLLNVTDEETQALAKFAANLIIPFNETAQLHPELDGYTGALVKQADVVLMNYPLAWPMSPTVASNDLAYYAERTDPLGPAMTWSVFGIGHASLGEAPAASAMFTKGFLNSSLPPYFQWYEVVGGRGCPNFLTGAGGFLQSVWAGLGSLRVERAQLTILGLETAFFREAQVETVTLEGLQYRGASLRVHYNSTHVDVADLAPSATAVVRVNGQPAPQTVARQANVSIAITVSAS